MKTKKVYVASSWRNAIQPAVVETISAIGFEVYDFRNPPNGAGFGWEEINKGWENWTLPEYVEALEHPRAVEGFNSDFNAMKAADIFVLVMPCGRSAHLELGWAVGAGKRTVILLNGATEPELMVKMVDHLAVGVNDLIYWLKKERLPEMTPAYTDPVTGKFVQGTFVNCMHDNTGTTEKPASYWENCPNCSAFYCDACNYDKHTCMGCGDDLTHSGLQLRDRKPHPNCWE